MKKILLCAALSFPFLSCGGAQEGSPATNNTELIVHYEGKEVHRRSKYISQNQLHNLIEQKKEIIIIFSAEWCKACKLTRKALTQANLSGAPVNYLNIDEPWVQKLAVTLKIRAVPYMFHIDSNGQPLAIKVGPGKIVSYLLLRY